MIFTDLQFTDFSLEDAIKIGDRTQQDNDTDKNDNAANDLVDDSNAIGIELRPNLVNEPRQSIPPKQGTASNTKEAYQHVERPAGGKGELGKEGAKENDDQRI